MSGRHRMPSDDGRTAGAVLLGSVVAGLALMAAQVQTSAPAALPLPEHAQAVIDRAEAL